MNPFSSWRLAVAISFFIAQSLPAPAQELSPALVPVSPSVDSYFNSDISRSPRFRDDLFKAPLSQPVSSRFVFEILPTPIQQAQDDEQVALPTPTPFATPVPTPLPTPTPTPVTSPTPVPPPPPIPTPIPTPIATPVPTPIPTPVPTPSIVPSPSPTPISTPVRSPSPVITRTPSFPVPPPNPAPRLSLPPAPQLASPLSAPDRVQIQRLTPIVSVWRSGAVAPQLPLRHGDYLETVYVPAGEAVVVRLQFDPLVAGKLVVFRPGRGAVVESPSTALPIGAAGQCDVSVGLAENAARGHVTFHCEGRMTTLPLSRAPVAFVAAKEQPNAGGAR